MEALDKTGAPLLSKWWATASCRAAQKRAVNKRDVKIAAMKAAVRAKKEREEREFREWKEAA